MAAIEDDLYGMQDISRISGFDRTTIRHHVLKGHLNPTRNLQGNYRFTVEDVRRMAAKTRHSRRMPSA